MKNVKKILKYFLSALLIFVLAVVINYSVQYFYSIHAIDKYIEAQALDKETFKEDTGVYFNWKMDSYARVIHFKNPDEPYIVYSRSLWRPFSKGSPRFPFTGGFKEYYYGVEFKIPVFHEDEKLQPGQLDRNGKLVNEFNAEEGFQKYLNK